MILPLSGPLSLLDIQSEFGGTVPIGMDEYFSNGSYAVGVSGIPASGNALNVGAFYGKAKPISNISVTSNNTYYSELTRVNGSSFTIVQSGANPDVQLQMNSSSYGSQVTYLYGQHRLQDFSSVEINFEIFITSSSVADALWFYMGQSTTPDGTQYENATTTGYNLIFEVYTGNSGVPRGINLFKNGSTSAVNYSTTAHISSTWLPVKIVYNKSSTNTWSITFNGTNIINYSDTNHATWLANSGRFWGIGSRTGGSTGDFYIRRLNVSTSQTMLLQYTTVGTTSWVAPFTGNVKTLLVAGGGGSGGAIAGGGGGGGVIYNSSFSVSKGTSYTMTVGAGGTAGGNTSGPSPGNGGNSVFSSLTAIGGGRGGIYGYVGGASGGSGGGGGGNATSSSVTSGGSGTAGQGNTGGSGYVYGSGSYAVGGGGGGAGGGGGSGTSQGGVGGAGGLGVANSITGSSVTYGGGGGGASRYSAGGTGGTGGGGKGAGGSSGTTTSFAVAGTNGLGGGAGGGANESNGQTGGSGIVILAYP
jgi:hypothetical protein